jgi:hypothetical protein
MKSTKSIVLNLAMFGILSMLGLDSWFNETPSDKTNPIFEQATIKADTGKDDSKESDPGPAGRPNDGWASKPGI